MFRKSLLTLSILLIELTSYAQHFNFQPCYAYWQLTDQLRKGLSPKLEDWDRLRQGEGYKRKNMAAWEQFVQQVTLVYTPGNEERVQQEMKTSPALQRIVRYAQEEAQLKQYIVQIDQRHIMDSARAYTNRMLPPKWQRCYPLPQVNFVLYDYDGSAREYGVTLDLLIAYDMDSYRSGAFLGHEMLHYVLFYCRVKLRHFKASSPEHIAAFTAVNAISEEGTADLIDKPFMLFDEHSPYREKKAFLELYNAQSGSCITKINQAFEALADQAKQPYTDSAYWKSIVLATGHVPGMYMGRVIQQQGLQTDLVKHIENPFRFFYLYNKAAQKAPSKPPLFSPKAIRFLKLMERKHY